jgi:hypothetical protein
MSEQLREADATRAKNCGIIVRVKTNALTPKQILAVPCPTCGAYANKPCELVAGQRRTQPHRARRWAASDQRNSVEMNQATARIMKRAIGARPAPVSRIKMTPALKSANMGRTQMSE